MQKDNVMITGDALLDFGDGHKIKLRPEELQKVTGERGRRGTLMRGLQRIDRVEIDSPRRASSGDSEE